MDKEGKKEEKEKKEEKKGALEKFESEAHKLFEEFKEYSVAEFFRKNRQMLGFTSKVRSLTTIVHEAVTNSVTWDTPVVIRENGETKIEMVGEIVDKLIDQNKEKVSKEKGVESLRDFKKFEVLCFDKNSLRLKFKEVKSIHRYKTRNEKIFRIKLVGGRTVEVTKYHSLFTIREGKIVPIQAEELKVGDLIVVPREKWPEGNIKEINLIEEILKLSDNEIKDVAVYGVRKILFNDKGLMQKIKSQLPPLERRYGFYSKYMKCDRLPIKFLRILSKDERSKFYNCKIGISFSKYRIPAIIEINRNFALLLGIYTAEGSTRKTLNEILFSFGAKEKTLIEFTKYLIKNVFGIKPIVRPAHETEVNVIIRSKTLAFILIKVFGYKYRACEKIIPKLIFNIPNDLAKDFLFGYLAGDGYPTKEILNCIFMRDYEIKNKITLATSSKDLALGLQYLLSMLGYTYSYQEKNVEARFIKKIGKFVKFKKCYIIEFYTKQRNSLINFFPIELSEIRNISDSRIKWALVARNQKFLTLEKMKFLAETKTAEIPKEAIKFANGGIGLLQIVDIKERKSDGEYVYDFSVENDENFVGGYGPICLHNSLDACEEAKILPNIYVKIENSEGDHLKVTVEDNGPGIPKEYIGKALGQMLAGTKFHRYVQQRGQQGIGISGVILYSQITTGKPVHIRSGIGDGKIYECDLSIDVKRNAPIVTNLIEYSGNYRGLTIVGEFGDVKYDTSAFSPYEYLKATAMANPHAQITFVSPNGEREIFKRSSTNIPPKPKPVKPHPLGITVDDLITYAHHSKERKLSSFLSQNLTRVSDQKINELKALCPNINFDKMPRELKWEEAEQIIKAFKQIKWIAPSSESLVPIGEKQIEEALKSLLNPEFLSVRKRSPKVYRGGVPFMVEVAIAYGGKAGREGKEGR
ncbi:MAG: DNA topoisomerase VI subunit B, partial [Candidatus Micrarchaeia archaeon]